MDSRIPMRLTQLPTFFLKRSAFICKKDVGWNHHQIKTFGAIAHKNLEHIKQATLRKRFSDICDSAFLHPERFYLGICQDTTTYLV